MKKLNAFLITAALIVGMAGCGGDGNTLPPAQNPEIRDWYDLDAVRNNLGGSYLLLNDLDSTTAGYEELASPTANGGRGWQPIGGTWDNPFTGTFDGQGYEIYDPFINRPDEDFVGLFGIVGEGGGIENMGVVNAEVTGESAVGGLAGSSEGGAVTNSYSSGNVTGYRDVGGLVGSNSGTVSNSYSASSVTGGEYAGGVVGYNSGTVSKSYSAGSVTGSESIGGLVGWNYEGTVSNSYSTGTVSGDNWGYGGLVGFNQGTVSNSYSAGSVTGDEAVGGLVGQNYQGTVVHSFWDVGTSGMGESAGGIGKTTTEMKNLTTFTDPAWNIISVDPGETDTTYTWNIVDGVTYPFLSWEL